MAKLTKKEIQEMEELEKERLRLRLSMMEALENYWKDIAAMERVNKITGGGDVTKEVKKELFSRYKVLEGLTDNQIDTIRVLISNRDELRRMEMGIDSRMKERLPQDAIWLNDIVWKEEDLLEQLGLFKRIGIAKVYYTDKSTAVMAAIVWFTKAKAKIIGLTNIDEYNEGLIIEL